MHRVLTAQHQRIDWGHPLTKGLRFLWCPAIGGQRRDIVGGRTATEEGGVVGTPAYLFRGIRQGAVSASYATPSALSFGAVPDLALPVYSVIAHVWSPSVTTRSDVFGRSSGAAAYDQNYVLNFNPTRVVRIGHREATGGLYPGAETAVAPASTPMLIGGTYDGTTLTVHAEGLASASTAATAPTLTSAAAFHLQIAAADGATRTNTGYATNGIGMVALWDRVITKSDFVSLTDDLFQFFETPSTRRTYILSPQGAAQAPRSMHQYRQRRV